MSKDFFDGIKNFLEEKFHNFANDKLNDNPNAQLSDQDLVEFLDSTWSSDALNRIARS